MTVHRDGHETFLECDECTETSAPDSEFSVMIAAAKAAGWTIKPQFGDGWSHICPAHKESPLDRAVKLFGG